MTTQPTPTHEWSESALEFLARAVRERRDFIGLSQEELASYGGPAKTTVSKIERAAQRSYPPRTQQQLEKALGWDRGAIATILRHAEADYFDKQADSILADYVEAPVPDLMAGGGSRSSASDLTDEELLAELTYRMRRYAREEGGSGDVEDAAKKRVVTARVTGVKARSKRTD